jgi:hypothetical protein
VVLSVLGDDVTPARLAALSSGEVAALAEEFGEYFESEAPKVKQVKGAIADALARWPVGSLGEEAPPRPARRAGKEEAPARRSPRRK